MQDNSQPNPPIQPDTAPAMQTNDTQEVKPAGTKNLVIPIIIFLIVVLLIVVGLFLFSGLTLNNDNEPTPTPTPITTVTPTQAEASITLEGLNQNDEIESGQTISGQAPGNWFFESSFTVDVVAADDTVLGTSIVTATEDAQTPDLVDFETDVYFVANGATEGKLVFHKQNASGLPENDESFEFPVRFAEQELTLQNLKPGQSISSGFELKGSISGSWTFEANFPIEIQGENGNTIKTIPTMVSGDWMTEDLVPFTVKLDFNKGSNSNGFIVIKKDNPSGLAENDMEFVIPVSFN